MATQAKKMTASFKTRGWDLESAMRILEAWPLGRSDFGFFHILRYNNPSLTP
jgi:hypothetical protein